MLLCGLLTCTMFIGLFSPSASLQSNFGENLVTGPENIVVRGWSALIGLMGVMLIYGAFKIKSRNFSLIIVGVSKVIFIANILLFGRQYLEFGLGISVIVDSLMIAIFIIYLVLSQKYRSQVHTLESRI